MSTTPDSLPAWRTRPLDPRQRRVLGVLIEKAKTTPAGYPMSVNAIVTGCNQKNNRDPLTAYDEADVEDALRELGAAGVVTEVDWLGRVPKYKHQAYEWLGVNKAELAVLAELLLRGAQTLGDLRARAARMEPIEDLTALKPIVDGLVARGLMVELTPAGRGQIVTHNLAPSAELAAARAALASGGAFPPAPRASSAGEPQPVAHEVERQAARPAEPPRADREIAELRAEISRLDARVRRLEAERSAADVDPGGTETMP